MMLLTLPRHGVSIFEVVRAMERGNYRGKTVVACISVQAYKCLLCDVGTIRSRIRGPTMLFLATQSLTSGPGIEPAG